MIGPALGQIDQECKKRKAVFFKLSLINICLFLQKWKPFFTSFSGKNHPSARRTISLPQAAEEELLAAMKQKTPL
jgi:hypothetical protein